MSGEHFLRSDPRHAGLVAEITRIFSDELQIEVPAPDTDLMETGLLDSLTFVNLLVHIEGHMGIRLSIEDLDVERFATISGIAALLMGS